MHNVFVFSYSMAVEKLAKVVSCLKTFDGYLFEIPKIVVVQESTGVIYKLASFVDIVVDQE